MPLTQFLSGLNWSPSNQFPNFYAVGDDKHGEYICAYTHRNNGSKKAICEMIGQKPGNFDFHHIIEDQHLADISVDGRLDDMYNYDMPTVLVHNLRHQLAYNSILHTKEMRHIYLGNDSESITIAERQEEAKNLYWKPGGKRQLNQRILEMKDLYFQVYNLDVTVRQIAMNVFDHYLEML